MCQSGAVLQGWGSSGASLAGATQSFSQPLPAAAPGQSQDQQGKAGTSRAKPRVLLRMVFLVFSPGNTAAACQEQSWSLGRA